MMDKLKWKWDWKIVIFGLIAIVAQLSGLNEHASDAITHGAEIFGIGGVAGSVLETIFKK